MNNKYSPEYRVQKKWAIWLFVALLCALLLNSLAGDYFKSLFFNFLAALTPVFIGLVLTFLFKKLLDFLEKKVFYNWFKKLKHGDKVNRIFCIALLFIMLFGVIYLIMAMIVPQIVDFIQSINSNVNGFVENIKNQLTSFFETTGWFNNVDIEQMLTDFINKIGESLLTNIPLIADSVSKIIQQTATFVMYFVVGVVISVIMLYKKEKIASFTKRLTYATFSKQKADKICKTARLSDKILYDYTGAKAIEALIVFAIMLPGLYIFKIPYPLVMALIMAIFNIIPYIGSIFAGAIIVIMTIALINVQTAIWIVIYMVVIMFLYGNFVGPFIYGKRMKVSSLLIILSLLVFGAIFGFWGFVLGPPLMAVLWCLLNDFVTDRENENLELESYGLSREDINDLEILREAQKIIKERRKQNQAKNEIIPNTELESQNQSEQELEFGVNKNASQTNFEGLLVDNESKNIAESVVLDNNQENESLEKNTTNNFVATDKENAEISPQKQTEKLVKNKKSKHKKKNR